MLTKREEVAGAWKQLHNEDIDISLQKVKLQNVLTRLLAA
jgi:hypothetical protein